MSIKGALDVLRLRLIGGATGSARTVTLMRLFSVSKYMVFVGEDMSFEREDRGPRVGDEQKGRMSGSGDDDMMLHSVFRPVRLCPNKPLWMSIDKEGMFMRRKRPERETGIG